MIGGDFMEKFLSRKIEVWLVGAIVVFLLMLMFAFGVIVLGVAQGSPSFGAVGRFSYTVASIPFEARRELRMLLRGDLANMSTNHSDRFPGRRGWTFFDARIKSGVDGYLLFSRHDGDVGHHVFEIVDLKAGETVHRIDLDASALFANAGRDSRFGIPDDWHAGRFQAIHPLALENGDILVKGHRTPMVRMSPCGEPLWTLDENVFHHTTEMGPDGYFWSTTWVEPQRVEGLRGDFLDPGLVQFTADGEILYDRSLTEVMLKQGLGYILFAAVYDHDPLHLNDVQPVFEDGPFWKRGDVFLSLRHLSMIMLFRPSTDEIVWFKQGPWAAQHDVDVIDETTIAVFNNNTYDLGSGGFVDGHSDIMFYDFATDKVSTPYADVLAAHDFQTDAAGLFTLLPDGHYYVDEAESGRTLIFTSEGELAAEHVNRAESGLIYHLGWSRYMDRAAGDRFLEQLKAADCG
jgi:hypothetical protein